MSKLYNTLSMLCDNRGISLYRMCKELGFPQSTTTDLKMGRNASLSQKKLEKIAEYFGVSIDYLLGNSPSPTNGGVMVPIYGEIAAGIPMDAIEYIEDYEEISAAMARTGEFLGLRIRGDSMSPRILDGDVVIFKKQDICEDGDVCAVLINGDSATCKRVKKTPQGIMLISNNPAYDPMFYSNDQIRDLPVRIIGIFSELRGKKV